MRYLYHDYYYHSIHAGRFECICWRLSSDAGQCGFPDEGLSSLCCVSLFAKAGCGESVTFGGFSKRLLDLSKTYSSFKTVWIPNNMILRSSAVAQDQLSPPGPLPSKGSVSQRSTVNTLVDR